MTKTPKPKIVPERSELEQAFEELEDKLNDASINLKIFKEHPKSYEKAIVRHYIKEIRKKYGVRK